jgi:uncharacterized Zn-finger protein
MVCAKYNECGSKIMDRTELGQSVVVTSKSVSCAGGGSSGHPNVYLKIGDEKEVVCPYCSRLFILNIGDHTGVHQGVKI